MKKEVNCNTKSNKETNNMQWEKMKERSDGNSYKELT